MLGKCVFAALIRGRGISTEHPAGSSGFQGVEVKTANPEFRVKARKGYSYGPGEATRSAAAGTGPG